MKATFSNLDENMTATVTPVAEGYAVTLIDCDFEDMVETRIYPKDKAFEAIVCARKWAFGKNDPVVKSAQA